MVPCPLLSPTLFTIFHTQTNTHPHTDRKTLQTHIHTLTSILTECFKLKVVISIESAFFIQLLRRELSNVRAFREKKIGRCMHSTYLTLFKYKLKFNIWLPSVLPNFTEIDHDFFVCFLITESQKERQTHTS